MSYPIFEIVDVLKELLKARNLVILQAPPGAGKSTILPLQLLQETWLNGRKIIMLEPRRLATRSVAQRMAMLLEETLGDTVGYRIRFESKTSARTKIEVVTEGILTRMIQSDNTLGDVGLIIFDEFHERSLQADLALTLSLQAQKIIREDLRILIMSATLDGEKLAGILGNSSVITSSGKQYPVDILYYNSDQGSPIPFRVARAVRKALQDQAGDILVFLPGEGEIRRTMELLQADGINVLITPLYGDLSFKAQQEAILPDPAGHRKIVLATSIAETSLTIEGITTVIDSGLSRVPRFDPRSGLTKLETVQVTADVADQRAGRAGRLGPGVCYRLWSQGSQQYLVPQRSPEILDADLAPMILELAQWGAYDQEDLTWITPPPMGAVNQAMELLHQLDALNEGKITDKGKEMIRLPTHPRIAHMLLEARHDKQLLSLAIDCAALLEERDPLVKGSGADLTLRLEYLKRYRGDKRDLAGQRSLSRIERLAGNWRRLFNVKESHTAVTPYDVGLLVAAAYPERIANQLDKHGERYKLATGRVVRLPSNDPLCREAWLAVAHLDAGIEEGKIFLAAPLNAQDLDRLAHEEEVVRWDADHKRITASIEKKIGPLVLSRKPVHRIADEKRIQVLCEVIRAEGFKMIGWEDEHFNLQARVISLRLWRPDEHWPDMSEQNLMDTLKDWLGPYLISINSQHDLRQLNLSEILITMVPWGLRARLETLAPQRLKVPSGSMIRLTYSIDGGPPVMEVRLQEMFGMLSTPTVNDGRTAVILHLLSPGFRPVQVTQDLHSFWQNTYPEVRKELRSRYPKHHWPEDPWTAQAVRGVKKR